MNSEEKDQPEIKKKRGRKPKSDIVKPLNDPNEIIITDTNNEEPTHKKRGRKPKGGKLITTSSLFSFETVPKINAYYENVILHLKCTMADLSNINNEIAVPLSNSIFLDRLAPVSAVEPCDNEPKEHGNNGGSSSSSKRDLWKNIKSLEYRLKHGQVNHKSDCFWCTCSFDNPTIYIPKMYNMDTSNYQVYGNFCCPECATAYLMSESIDTSVKFERYHLLIRLYSKIYGYSNIKPAPNPRYTLNRYLGNLSIQEYRTLLRDDDHLFLVIDKPMSQIIPQLHIDCTDLIVSSMSTTVKRSK
jgi:hypothetical protein